MRVVPQHENNDIRPSEKRETRVSVCPNCKHEFTQRLQRRRPRTYCSDRCRKQGKATHHQALRALGRLCIRGCGRKTGTRKELCEACYAYERRVGNVGPAPKKRCGRFVTKDGYVRIRLEGHILCTGDGMAYEHRVVLHERLGDEPSTSCHWCGAVLVGWRAIVVDHLNEQKADNRPENVVPTCNRCNRARGAMVGFISRLRPDRIDQFLRVTREFWSAFRAKG